MKSVLEEVYYSSEGLSSKIVESQEYNNSYKKFNEVYERLIKELNDGQKDELIELSNLAGNIEAAVGITHFIEGFKFCMRLMFEGMGQMKKIL